MTKVSGFSDDEIAAVFFTISDVEVSSNGSIKLVQQSVPDYSSKLMGGVDGPKPGCNMDWCLICGLTGGNYTCESSCDVTIHGCGWFLTQECTKICKIG